MFIIDDTSSRPRGEGLRDVGLIREINTLIYDKSFNIARSHLLSH